MRHVIFCYVSIVIFGFEWKLRVSDSYAAVDISTRDVNDTDFNVDRVYSVSDLVHQRRPVFRDGSSSNRTTGKTSNRRRYRRNFIPWKRYWWQRRYIPYILDKSLGVTGRKAFQAAIADFEKNTCIRFRKHTNETDYVWVYRGSGCSSSTGKSGGKQTVSLGKGCRKKGVVIHELLHALGMMHEHCRADRNQFIRINFENIKPKARVEYEILNGYTTGEPYDYGSVLHYGSFFFSLDPKIPTIVKLMPGGPKIGQRRGFSDLDLRKINKLYECKNYIKHKPAPQKQTIKTVSGDCSFERGFCNWMNWKNKVEDQFDWKLGRLADESSSENEHKQRCGNFIFFNKPSAHFEYMSSGVLSSGFLSGSCCLRFYYHMIAGGYLRVFIKGIESKRRNPYVLIWEKVGPQGNEWKKMEQSIAGASEPYKIYIEGIKTPHQTGIVAVDDVCVVQGRTCVWNFIFFNKPSAHFEYMSSGVLSSGFLSGSCCLRFYYHMIAGGYLRVFIKGIESKRRNPYVLIWEKVGPQGNEWKKMEQSIAGASEPYKIYIEGIKTPHQTGIVAVDDVCVVQGRTCVCK